MNVTAKKKNPQPSQCQNENCDADRFVKPHHHFNYWKCLRVKARDHPKYDVFGASSPDHACSSAGLHFVTHHNFSKAYRWDSSHESGLKVTSMFSSMTRSYRHIGGLEKMEDIAWGYFIPRANFIYTPFLSNSVKHFKKKKKHLKRVFTIPSVIGSSYQPETQYKMVDKNGCVYTQEKSEQRTVQEKLCLFDINFHMYMNFVC